MHHKFLVLVNNNSYHVDFQTFGKEHIYDMLPPANIFKHFKGRLTQVRKMIFV